jgi:hypothetical protein
VQKLALIKGGVELASASCTLFLPKFMEIHVVLINTQVGELEKPITPKPVPLTILEIRVGREVTLINTITHAFKIFRIPNILLKDTLVDERPKLELVPMAELVDITCEKLLMI